MSAPNKSYDPKAVAALAPDEVRAMPSTRRSPPSPPPGPSTS